MKNTNITIRFFIVIVIGILAAGCAKNETNYYPDGEDPGLAIFSNMGNNLLTCYINGEGWRTIPRINYPLGPRSNYEVYLDKQFTSNSLRDTLYIRWQGYSSQDNTKSGYIQLQLPLPYKLSASGLSALQGQRIHIDTTNGFFSVYVPGMIRGNAKGSGTIYFHTARFDSVSANAVQGNMSGLFDADFGTFKITRGRFDHIITADQVRL